ncbi:MAG: hypothetical protein M3N53_02950 [Actinomycetota bacterium]|nr:hypothetical protein [Actinomycetota bacterium]
MTPHELREAARRLWALAERVPAPIEHVRARAGSGTWIGPAAERFHSDLAVQARVCRSAADELRATAKRVFARAEALEHELALKARREEMER